MTLSGCKNDDILFDLIGGDEVGLNVGDTWTDPGFIVKDDTVDISDYVVVYGEVDTTTAGIYEISYTLVYDGSTIEKIRTVTVGAFNSNCDIIEDTDLMSCGVVWTSYLNTVVKLTLYVDQDTDVNTDIIFDDIEEILEYYTVYSDKYTGYSEAVNVYAINQDPSATHVIDERLFNLIEFTKEHQAEVNNLFNMALGPVLQIWHDYRENCTLNGICEVPDMADLQNANLHTDVSKVILDRDNLTITMEESMGLDLGGVSKGYVSREIIDYLDTYTLHGYLLNNGESNISIGGSHPTRENEKFVIAIIDPTYNLPYYATVYLGAGDQLVTSGDYQKYYMVDDVSYHHIINPNTLMPVYYSRSVSIITSDPALADLYSTAIFNMTIEEGQTFVNGIEGLEAVWYASDGTIYFSENFESQYLLNLYN